MWVPATGHNAGRFTDQAGEETVDQQNNQALAEREADNWADAMAMLAIIVIAVATAVVWVSGH